MRGTLHITVGTSMEPHGQVDIDHELRLIKAALLYADKVRLCSLASSFLVQFAQFTKLPKEDRIHVASQLLQQAIDSSQDESMRQLSPWIPYLAEIRKKRKLKSELKKHMTGAEFLQLHRLDKEFGNLIDGLNPAFDESLRQLTDRKSLGELERAIDSGLIELQQIDPNTDHVVQDFFDAVVDSINSDQTYPLFDAHTADLVNLAMKEGLLEVSDVSAARAKGVALSGDLLRRLPLFDSVSIDQIIEIRQELDKPLIRFRAAMMDFSDEIVSAAWDSDFSRECESILVKKVEPAILEIEEAVQSNRRLRVYTETFVNEKGLVAASSLGLLLASASNLVDTISQFVPAAALPTATIVLKSELKHKENREEIERNQLYFYYKSGELMQSQHRRK